jgi:excisionase family DNA binding protein
MGADDSERLFTVGGVAKRLGLGKQTLRREIAGGKLRAYHVGGWTRLTLADVAAWLETRRRPTPSGSDGGCEP